MKVCQRAERFYFRSGDQGIVLIHGFTGTPWSVRELGWMLAANGFTIVAPRLPGHGKNPSELTRFKYEDWLDEAREAVRFVNRRCGTVGIVGLSAGGTIALNLASEMHIDKLVCLSAPIESKAFRRLRFEKWIGYWPKWHSLCKRMRREQGYRVYPLKAVHQFYRLLDDTKEKLSRVSCPALLMHSRADRTVSCDQMEIIASMIRSEHVECTLLNGRQHALTLGNKGEKVQKKIIRYFLNDLSVMKKA